MKFMYLETDRWIFMFYTASIMTNILIYAIFISEEKADRRVQRKDRIQMSTDMIFGYLKREYYDEALDSKQGLVFVYTFLRERKHGISR